MSDFKIKLDAELKGDVGQTIQSQLDKLGLKINFDYNNVDTNKIKQQAADLAKNYSSAFENHVKLDVGGNSQFSKLSSDLKGVSGALNDHIKKVKDVEKSHKDLQKQELFSSNQTKTVQQVSTYISQNTRATKEFGTQLEILKIQMANATDPKELTLLRNEFITLKSKIKEVGQEGRSMGEEFKNATGKFSSWIGASTMVMSLVNTTKNAFGTIRGLDSAMIELRTTANGTTAELNNFYHASNDIAKSVGVSTEAILNATSVWSRLGYSMKDSIELAESTAIFKALSPEISDITTAADGLVSILKGFNLEASESVHVISALNEVGNNFAADNSDAIEIMKRSSAAMAAANNTMEETIALGIAAVEVTRDAAQVGNALKTVSMRIRGYDEETNQLSDDLKELAGDIADLTHGRISLFTDEDKNTYKSTYDIMKDISEIYDELTDKEQARLFEKLGGKQQGQVVAALLSNFSQAEAAMDAMAGSAGSIMDEMDIIADSIDYKLNRLKETGVGVFQNLINSDVIKLSVDALTSLLEVIEKITDALGGLGTLGGVLGGALAFKGKGWANYSVVDIYLCPCKS